MIGAYLDRTHCEALIHFRLAIMFDDVRYFYFVAASGKVSVSDYALY